MLLCAVVAAANLIVNPGLESADGVAPDGWSVTDRAAVVTTGGVVRVSQATAPYYRGVLATMPADGSKSYVFSLECRSDAMLGGTKLYYSLLDERRRPVVSNAALNPFEFKGPLDEWTRVAYNIPARDPTKVRFVQVSVAVYNKTRKPGAPDCAFYFRNPRLEEFEGQKQVAFPFVKADADNPFPPAGYAVETAPYLLEQGGVGYLNLVLRAVMVHRKAGDLVITAEAPEGVETEVHRRCVLFRAGPKAPEAFTLRLRSTTAKGRNFSCDVPVKVIARRTGGRLPGKLRYWSWTERPLHAFEPLDTTKPLARALEGYWRGTGWVPVDKVDITHWVHYRQQAHNPHCPEAVGIGGEPIGCPCDSEQIALGVDGFRRRLEGLDTGRTLAAAKFVTWDYEPYVLGPVTVGCWCPKCQAEFRRRYGLADSVKPAEILDRYRAKWVDFRCEQRKEVLQAVVAAVKAINPGAKFMLTTMPYSPGRDDLAYLERWGLDHRRFVPFVDIFTSMNYGNDPDVYRSLEREIRELGKPVQTLLTNGWDEDGGRDPRIVRQQFLGAYFIGLDCPCLAPGIDRTRGDTLAALRTALEKAAEGADTWLAGRLAEGRLPLVADANALKSLYSVDRVDGRGRRWTLIVNTSVTKGAEAVLKTEAGDVPVRLGPIGCKIVESRETVLRPFAVSPWHLPRKVMGREYWTYLSFSPLTDPATWGEVSDKVWDNPWNNPALTNVPVFAECGIATCGGKLPPDPKGTASCLRTVKDHCGKEVWEGLERNHTRNRPLVFTFAAKRNVLAMEGDVDIDHEDWRRFKVEHPNLVCTRTMCEWGNDLLLNIVRTTNVLNKARHDALMANWAKYDRADRYDRLALCKWYADRKKLIHYGDMETFMAFRGIFYLDHVAAAWGAKYLVGETTNTTGWDDEFRWDVSGMFLRGAARQFQVPWAWYVAVYYNGPRADGTWMNNSCARLRGLSPRVFPEGGVSASSQRRAWYYAYLNGANAVEPESWTSNFFTTNTPSGKAELAERGRNFAEFHEFTKRHPDRGVAYAPVAILTPFAQGYRANGGPAWGSCPMTDGDYALDALFFTIAPGWKRREGLSVGNSEGNLHNSRFAMMYDVLVPDSPQSKEDFRRALFAYPAAILVGDYPEPQRFQDVLDAYVKAGGELVRITPDLLPPRTKDSPLRLKRGELKCPEIERRLEALQNRLFPFRVAGDVQFGASRTERGWWLWTFNNRGVVKFADTMERIDRTKDTTVEVDLGAAARAKVTELLSGETVAVRNGRFTAPVPAGDFRVFSVQTDK